MRFTNKAKTILPPLKLGRRTEDADDYIVKIDGKSFPVSEYLIADVKYFDEDGGDYGLEDFEYDEKEFESPMDAFFQADIKKQVEILAQWDQGDYHQFYELNKAPWGSPDALHVVKHDGAQYVLAVESRMGNSSLHLYLLVPRKDYEDQL